MRGLVAIQCKSKSGEWGTFLYHPDTKFDAISPIFPGGFIDLLSWLKRNGWRSVSNSSHPIGEYENPYALSSWDTRNAP